LTTLELGGAARFLVHAESDAELLDALRWAAQEGVPTAIVGGGSNLIVPDAGFAGLVIAMRMRGVREQRAGEYVELTASAGEVWDELVARSVEAGLLGLECLSGIPGLVGATPIQNVGAYGQEVASTIGQVHVIDRQSLSARVLGPEQCGFGYRTSVLKREPERFAVTAVTFRLATRGAAQVVYPELARALELRAGGSLPSAHDVRDVRAAVLELRRSKSMVIDPADENRRSAGSFFLNPVVPDQVADQLLARLLADGVIKTPEELPRFAAGRGQVKLAAAWLIERAGFRKGERRGPVGISSRHALALVHHGAGSTRELLALASEITARVHARFGITLEREPVLLAAAS